MIWESQNALRSFGETLSINSCVLNGLNENKRLKINALWATHFMGMALQQAMQTVFINCFRHCRYGCEHSTEANSDSGTDKHESNQLVAEKDVDVTC